MGDSLGDRMKDYERLTDTRLTPRVPVLARLDGKAFHSYTAKMQRPWDLRLVEAMQRSALHLCENIQGCRFAYVQSDEITLVLTDWDRFNSQSWFDYRVQKMCSIAASMCSVVFHAAVRDLFPEEEQPNTLPMFDARFWNVPRHEVVNAVLWRQQDATRNSIQMLAQSKFSHNQLQGKNTSQLQEMLHAEHGLNWNDTPTHLKRGTAIYKRDDPKVGRPTWYVDVEPPIFSKDRDFIGKHLTDVFWKEDDGS